MVSQNTVEEYLENCTNRDEKQFIQNALDSERCKFDFDAELKPRQLAVIVKVPEFEQINKTYYGLYMICFLDSVAVWLAVNTDCLKKSVPAGSYSCSDSISSIINRARKNLNTCDICGKNVGLANLKLKTNKKICLDCSRR